MLSELFKLLGKDVTSQEAKVILKKHGLTVVRPVPPGEVFYGFPKGGVDLLAKDDQIVDVQIFVQPTKRFSSYTNELPFGIKKDMTQKQVHKLLGKPSITNEVRSEFDKPEIGAKLNVFFDKTSKIEYISVSIPY